MANRLKCVNNEYIEMTDEEEARAVNLDIPNASYHRNRRNELLAQSDWMAMPDRTMTEDQKAYRQALRDLPTHSKFPNLDEESDYPTKPE